MKDTITKTSRLDLIRQKLVANPAGCTTAELSQLLKTPPRTILRDISTLEGEPYYLPIIAHNGQGNGKIYQIDPNYRVRLTPVIFDGSEATALFIAARLLSQHSGRINPVARSAILKLTRAMPPAVSDYLLQAVSHANNSTASEDPALSIFEALVTGWIEQRKVICQYRYSERSKFKSYTIAPYNFEPSAVGYAIYVIGQCDSDKGGQLRTIKLDRIRQAALTPEKFDYPKNNSGQVSAAAWRIWDSDQLPTEVRLRFLPRVVARVKETVWHPGQQLLERTDGSFEWVALVAEIKEMLPWIRGWGADCEVLAPRELRDTMLLETRRLTKLYRLPANPPDKEDNTAEASLDNRLRQTYKEFF